VLLFLLELGSGKTAVLIEHLVTWIKNLPSFKTTHEYQLVIDLKSLVVITFTVKASQEMKMRLFERIHSLQQSEVESWKIVKKHINNIYIGTIDGFCAKIINKNLPTLNLSVPFDIVSNQEWEDKIQGLYNAWSSSLINQDDITISKIWHKKILDWLISVLASTSSRLAWQKFSTLEVNAEKFIVENTNILNKLFEEHNWSENISQLVASLDSLNSSDCQSKTWYQFLCKLKLKTQSRINLEIC
jgi:ATP-dependent helicase/nuclease subunit A